MNKNLHAAKVNKNDEFYTQLTDIEKELWHYKDHFKGKTIFCNCNDPNWSNFVKYFAYNFDFLGLKKIIGVYYKPEGQSYKLELNQPKLLGRSIPDCQLKQIVIDYLGLTIQQLKIMEWVAKIPLQGNGDFRSPECIELLKQSDIVCTNPPFSLFREYVAQLIEYDKKFLIIGNVNAVTYKEIFPLIKENKVWWGVSPRNMSFITHNKEIVQVNSVWYTNLTHKKRNEELILFRVYKGHEEDYPKYDNYDAIEVSRSADIPKDYDGVMGVPITFLDKYNPRQFEIIKFRKGDDDKDLSIDGKCPYFRILIRREK